MTKAVTQPLPSGNAVKFRREQMILWGIVAGFLGAGFIAGLYFGILEVNWHVFWLKPWWDGLFKQAWWPVYRHTAFRDIPEPAFATLGVYTMLAKPKYWDRRVGTLRLTTTPVLIILLTFALGILGTWLLNFAFGHPVLQWHSAGNLILGFAIGHTMRYLWQPVGATIQGHILESRAQAAACRRYRIPLWVQWPIAPPVLRERFTKMYYQAKLSAGSLHNKATASAGSKWLIGIMALVFIVVTVIGLLGHYYAGTGHVIPFLPTTR